MPRTFRLRITLDDAYPGIVGEAVAAIRAVRGPFSVSRQRRDGCIKWAAIGSCGRSCSRSMGRAASTKGESSSMLGSATNVVARRKP